MSEYITEEGKVNDIETVKAQAEPNQGCACSCSQDLSNYVLSVDFVNALQNIRQMIQDSLDNVDLSTIYRKLIIEIQERLKDVWQHIGIIEKNTLEEAKLELQRLSGVVQGNTKVLAYKKQIKINEGTTEEQTITKQMNDLYVYVGQINESGAAEHESLKWVKLMTFDTSDTQEDISLDDIIKRLEKLEKNLSQLSNIVTSIWSYLCKNWWEFIDSVSTTAEERAIKNNAVVGQNYYDTRDGNIYVYLKVGGTEQNPTYKWIPIANFENIRNAWRHVEVVNTRPTTVTANDFVGATKIYSGDKTVYVCLPTQISGTTETQKQWIPLFNVNNIATELKNYWKHVGVISGAGTRATGSGAVGNTKYNFDDKIVYVYLPNNAQQTTFEWVPLISFDKIKPKIDNAWRHIKVENRKKPSSDGTEYGETRLMLQQDDSNDNKNKGDVFVWLPTTAGTPGTGKAWYNITRNKEIDDIKNYVPEYVKYEFTADDIVNPLLRKRVNNGTAIFSGTIERSGFMVNLILSYNCKKGSNITHVEIEQGGGNWPSSPRQDRLYDIHNYKTGAAGEYRNNLLMYVLLTSKLPEITTSKYRLLGKMTEAQENELDSIVDLSKIKKVQDRNGRTITFNTNLAKQYFCPSLEQKTLVSLGSANFISEGYTCDFGGETHNWSETWQKLASLATYNNIINIPQNYDFSDANSYYKFLKTMWDQSTEDTGYSYTKFAIGKDSQDPTQDKKVDGRGGTNTTENVTIYHSGIVRFGSTERGIDDHYWMRKQYSGTITISWPGQEVTTPFS